MMITYIRIDLLHFSGVLPYSIYRALKSHGKWAGIIDLVIIKKLLD